MCAGLRSAGRTRSSHFLRASKARACVVTTRVRTSTWCPVNIVVAKARKQTCLRQGRLPELVFAANYQSEFQLSRASSPIFSSLCFIPLSHDKTTTCPKGNLLTLDMWV
jgi:hypothetical protein